MGKVNASLRHAFRASLPIMAGYGFLGVTYGIYMHELGFSFVYPMLLAVTVYAGSAEFLLGNMLLGSFRPIQAFLMVLMINARHLFYGLSMLDRYKGLGWKKFFLIFGMSDETFALTSSAKIPEGADRGWFLLWITWLDEAYWVAGATLGGIIGPYLKFDLKGLDFVLTAMFVAIFADNWLREKNHTSSVSGLFISAFCLLLFGADNFIIPSMMVILLFLTIYRKRKEGAR
ncbi:MAG TPA: branched-chain amino acid transporter AzlC [Prevotella sp.]|nr:branched-chain amino acid transporter AzlC [Prevotella sp.]